MSIKEDYIKKVEINMNKYKDKIAKIDGLLKNHKSSNSDELLNHREDLKKKLEDADKMLKKINSAGEKEFEELKEKATEVFDEIKTSFHEFSSFLSIDKLYDMKDEIVEFGSEKIDDAQKLIKQYPLASAMGALSLGFILGRLFTHSK